jgi:hypothetical protein
MCRPHWRMVPTALQNAIWDSVGQPERRDEYLENVEKACRAVGEKLGVSPEQIELSVQTKNPETVKR